MADPDGNTYGPYDLEVEGSYAEEFSEEAYYRAHDESGVVSGGELTFDGLTAQLAALHAYSHGSWLERTDVWEDTSPATTTPAPRRDMLVLRRTRTVGEGETAVPGSTVPLVLHGTPATTPADPDYDEDTDEPLWSWQVPGSGGTAVTAVTDWRRWVDEAGRPLPVQLTKDQTAAASATNTSRVALPGVSGTVRGGQKVTATVHAQSAVGASGGELGRLVLRIDGAEVRRAQWRNAVAGASGDVSAQVTYSTTLAEGLHTIDAVTLRVAGGSKVTISSTQLVVTHGGPA